ncbi:MAG: hypothetical protein FJX75_13345 [Armatimonadetes bacterium]|nr:hypothetical protein [Armatimonadota bacterium]
MARSVRHFSLHRIDHTELRVVSDVETGILPLVEVEESVIRGYTSAGPWPHAWVTLIILQDLDPLVRQLTEVADLPPGGVEALRHRPVANVYDLADLSGCHVFVNCEVMTKEGYQSDLDAIRGLLTHEHAHPLAENETTRASRQLRLRNAAAGQAAGGNGATEPADGSDFELIGDGKVDHLVHVLAEKLCLYAPREIFANQLMIQRGFENALLHLDRLNVANACESVTRRGDLQEELTRRVQRGSLPAEAVPLLMLLGDLRGYVDLALEIAPFYREGRKTEARSLEAELEAKVFPSLSPEVRALYAKLRSRYVALEPDCTVMGLQEWGGGILALLAGVLGPRGLSLQYRLEAARTPTQEGDDDRA